MWTRTSLFCLTLALAASAAADPPPARTQQYDFGSGGKAHTKVFGIEAEGYKFVYVIDRSGSMGGDGTGHAALRQVKAQVLASLQDLDTVHQFQIIFYNEKPRIFNPTGQPGRLAFGTEQNKTSAERFINGLSADGGTAHDDALTLAIRLRPDVIFWFTDADDPKLDAHEIDRVVRLASGITINAIEFGSGPQPAGETFLAKVAGRTGGKYGYVDVSKATDSPR